MLRRHVLTFLAGLTTLGARASGSTAPPPDDVASAAVSPDPARSGPARTWLRARGQAGLDALVASHAEEVRLLRRGELDARGEELLRLAIDAVAGQRDAAFSRLYWFTDLDKAKAEAASSGRPILSLRLLGRLDEDLSCANSRFFRTVLYANAEVGQVLRSRFVLHWQSVRPAPVLTVDYGDGRRLTRTITGNSLHAVLAPDGSLVDVLPGLWGPRAFLRALERDEETVRRIASLDPAARRALLRERWAADARQARRDLLRAGFEEDAAVTSAGWAALAGTRGADALLDESSIALMRWKSRGVHDAPGLRRVVAALQASIAEDTARNELALRPQALERLVSGPDAGVDQLVARIYDEVFLTPRQDPWLGLLEPDAYAALDREGRVGPTPVVPAGRMPTAFFAGQMTPTKMAVERKPIRAVDPRKAVPTRQDLVVLPPVNEMRWAAIR